MRQSHETDPFQDVQARIEVVLPEVFNRRLIMVLNKLKTNVGKNFEMGS